MCRNLHIVLFCSVKRAARLCWTFGLLGFKKASADSIGKVRLHSTLSLESFSMAAFRLVVLLRVRIERESERTNKREREKERESESERERQRQRE